MAPLLGRLLLKGRERERERERVAIYSTTNILLKLSALVTKSTILGQYF